MVVEPKMQTMPYGGMGRTNVTPVMADFFKGRYRVEGATTSFSCMTQNDLKASLLAIGMQETLISYVFNSLHTDGICELKYKGITITDDEWVRAKGKGMYNPANEHF